MELIGEFEVRANVNNTSQFWLWVITLPVEARFKEVRFPLQHEADNRYSISMNSPRFMIEGELLVLEAVEIDYKPSLRRHQVKRLLFENGLCVELQSPITESK